MLVGAGALAGIAGSRYFSNEKISPGLPYGSNAVEPNMLNDASLLSPTRVAKHIVMENQLDDQFIAALRGELAEAKSTNRPFIASAARHSMGGQAMVKDGSVVTLDQRFIEPDVANQTYRVAPGMRWNQVIAELDKIGFSPKVMQSNSDFAVASTFSVNAHGWPVPFSAGGSTVRSIKLMLHDGQIIECSRSQNADQFNLAMGGYGLNGIITELEVEMVPNARLQPKFEILPGKEFGTRFVEAIKADPSIQMAYGRMDVAIDGFFDEALMITYTPTKDQNDLPPSGGSGFLSKVSRHIFRNQLDSDRGKNLRWYVEKHIGPNVSSGISTRSHLMNEPVITLDDRDPGRTDILHEYFVAPERFGEFVEACQDVIPSSYQQLLNITLRYVDTDKDSVMAYATTPRIASVMLFSQEMLLLITQ